MKKLAMVMAVILLFAGMLLGCKPAVRPALAEEVNFKQGFLYIWQEKNIKNLTTFEIAKTKSVEKFGIWNILIEGWSMDIGGAYNSEDFNGALLIGREFGVIGKYLPINFPLKDKISITIYPVGFYVRDLFDHPELQLASGVGIIKLSLKF